jgi:GT2 family glycosyltransferase
VVCDDGPDDATRACVEAIAAEQAARGLAVRYVPVTRTQGPAGARNAGWRLARAPLIAFTDDDTLPDPHWLSAGVAALANGAAAASGRIIVPLRPLPTDYEADASGLAHAEFATANAFVSRAFLNRTGGFDERFTSAWREDSDLQFMLMQAGGEILRASDAVVVHPVRPARWGVSIAQQRKSQFDALLYRKHPELFRTRIRARPPLLYYAILCAALAALGGALAGNASVALGGFAVWFALTAYFCAIRLRGRDRGWRHIAEMAWTSIPIPFLSIYWRLYGAFRFKVFFL